jgi:hypothetical protein
MKHYEITVQAVATVYVAQAKDEQEAYKFARDVLSHGDFEEIGMSAVELTTEDERKRSQRHATAWSAP